ncbi:MAG: tandem-95 repeat protein, partial [Gemmataceae bacterium]|nr:tandem-95 repeat protein [Gemmataceae bacterium]
AGTAPPPGKPTLVGGTGNDTIRGGAGNDVIYGGNRLADVPGQSTAAADDDEIEGLGGDDFIDGGAGSDRIFGGVKAGTAPPPGKPTLVGGTGNDTIRGGAGNDVIYGATLIGTAFAGPDDDDIEGAGGDDLIDGGVGNDRIFGGVKTGAAPAGSPTLIGGRGNDTVVGGAGNDVIYGDDRLALTGADPATPAVGGVKLAAVRAFAADDDEIEGGWGDDAIDGGTGNDRIFGGVKAGTPPPAGATDRDTLRGGLGNDTVRGGAGNDVIYGGAGDDDLGGGDGDDIADGGSGLDLLTEAGDADLVLTATTITVGGRAEPFFDIEGVSFAAGPGANRLDASAFPGPVALDGGAGNDTLLGTAFGDVLAGGPGDDSVVAGAGADRLDAGGGNDVLDGGDDNDVYLIPLSGVVLVRDGQGIDGFDLSAAGLAAVADLAAGTVIDAAGNRVTAPAGAIENLTATGFDDTVRGSADRNILSGGGGADALDGGAEADTLRGGFLQVVYLDFDSASGAGEYRYTVEDRNRIQARLEAAYAAPFTVAFTQTRPPAGRYATVVINAGEASENEVLAGGVAAVDARNADPGAGAAVNVNGFVGRAGQPPATPDNTVGLTATVVAHELGHLFGLRHADAAGPIGRNPATGLAYGVNPGMFEAATARETVAGAAAGGAAVRYALKNVLVRVAAEPQVGDAEVPFRAPAGVVYDGPTAVATFTVNTAGGVDLTPVGSPARRPVSGTLVRAGGNPADPPTDTIALAWDAAPAESSVDVLYQYSPVRPAYPGPADAGETVRHIMASPASLGSSVADAIAPTWFGERELIKMAWADAGVSRPEAALPTAAASGGLPAPVTSKVGAGGRVKDLGNLPELAVPNLLPQGATHSGKTLAVRAAGVVGRLDLNSATGRAESDVYAVAGRAGEFLSAELYSVTLRQRLAPFDGVIRVYGPAGQVLAYFGRPAGAESDDGVDNEDPALQDVELPADGTYFVEVDTYADARVGDRAFGGYELFVYTYATPAAPAGLPPGRGSGDSLAGGAGADTVTGGSGGDLYVGSETEDAFLGRTDVDQTVGTLAARPTAAVVLTPDRLSPGGPGAPLVAAVTAAGTPGVPVFLSYVWSVDGAVVRTLPSTAATRDVLPVVGFRAGQVVSVTVTPRDANGVGRPVTASVVAGDAPPAAQPQTLTVLEDAALAAPLDLSDPTGLPVAPAVRRAPAHGAVTFDATGLGFRYTPAPDYHGADLFRYAGVSRLGAGNEAVVSVTVVPVNDAPSFAPGADVTVAEDAGRQLRVGWATGISAGPANEAGQGLAFLVTTDNPGLFAAGPAVAPDGTLSFTPAADAFGVATVTVVLRDDGGTEHGGRDTSAARTFTVTVTPVNDAPTVPSGTFTTPQDTPFAGQAAGADPDDVALTYAVVTNPAHGAVVLDPLTGAFTYTPAAGYTGPDEFTYRASDGRLDSNRGTAAITVGPTAGNAAPVAGADAAETTEDAAVLVDAPGVLGNDTDPNAGDTLAVSAVAGEPANVGRVVPLPSGASVRVTADGGFAYDPNGVFNGLKAGQTATDSFTYEVSDGKGGTATGTVTVTIAGRNDPPAATVALDLTAPKTSDTLTATATKSDPDGDAVSLTFVWTVNGNTVRTFSSATALTDTLDLSVAGNGDAGDVVKVTVTPSDGAADGPAASAEATVAAGPPPAPAITGVGDDTGADAADGVTRDTTLTVTGTGTAGTTVTVYRDDVAVGTAAVGSSGGWVYDGTGTALADGPYTYTAAAAYPGGALGPVSAGYAVTVDTKAPEVRKFLVLYGPAGKEKEYDLVGASRLTLPWAVTGFRVVFSEPVVGTAAGLSLTDRLGKALAVSKVAGSGTDTLTWTPAAAITLDLVTAAVATSGTDAVADPAGNALATARTSFKPAVVLGDVTGDKKVNSLDLLAFRKVLTTAGSADPLYPFCDIDGDGDVDAADQKMLQDRIGKHLPT